MGMAQPAVRGGGWAWVLLGGVVAASFDAAFATGYWKLTHDVPPQRIFQSIAAGVLGRSSFEGGAQTAWLGAGLHYGIAIVMALVYAVAARRWPRLIERPVSSGLIYGVLLYVAMTFVVVPLSAANAGNFSPPWVIASIMAHLLIGVIIAWFARKAWRL